MVPSSLIVDVLAIRPRVPAVATNPLSARAAPDRFTPAPVTSWPVLTVNRPPLFSETLLPPDADTVLTMFSAALSCTAIEPVAEAEPGLVSWFVPLDRSIDVPAVELSVPAVTAPPAWVTEPLLAIRSTVPAPPSLTAPNNCRLEPFRVTADPVTATAVLTLSTSALVSEMAPAADTLLSMVSAVPSFSTSDPPAVNEPRSAIWFAALAITAELPAEPLSVPATIVPDSAIEPEVAISAVVPEPPSETRPAIETSVPVSEMAAEDTVPAPATLNNPPLVNVTPLVPPTEPSTLSAPPSRISAVWRLAA